MVRFREMTEEEFAAYRVWLVEDYAGEIARNYQMDLDDARRRSEQQTSELLPDGRATPNHLLFVLLADNASEPVGHLWCHMEPDKRRAFVYDIVVHEPYRRRGYGRSALIELEQLLTERGIERLGLHVFGENQGAQALYQKLGYRITGMSMQKELPRREGVEP